MPDSTNNQIDNNSQNIDEQTTRNIANLARLGIQDQEVLQIEKDLNKILKMVNQLSDLDTSNVKPMMHPLDLTQNLKKNNINNREDVIAEPHGIHPAVEKNAPEFSKTAEGEFFFLTPKVI